jgi:hypothetical protein
VGGRVLDRLANPDFRDTFIDMGIEDGTDILTALSASNL